MTEVVVVERRFAAPVTMEEMQAREDAVAWCLEQYAVRFVRSYFSVDRRTMFCIYRAPDAESVRATQRQGGLPVDRIWTAAVCGVLDAPAPPPPRSLIVVEREFPEPVTMELVEQTLAREGHYLAMHRAELLASLLSRDGHRMCCTFSAPDAESVRIANRCMGMPVTNAWPATLHVPPSHR